MLHILYDQGSSCTCARTKALKFTASLLFKQFYYADFLIIFIYCTPLSLIFVFTSCQISTPYTTYS